LYCIRLIKDDVDILHSIDAYPYAIPAAILSKISNKPLIIGTQGTYAVLPLHRKIDGFLLRFAYKQAKFVYAPSRYTKKRIQSKVSVPIKIIYNPVDYETFSRNMDLSDLKEKFGENQIILSVGALKPRKGYDVMIRAFGEVNKIIPDSKYLIIGEGNWRGYLEALIDKLGLHGKVLFLGEKNGIELIKYYQICDVYAHTPVNVNDNFEGFGIVYLEAGAAGKPTVGSDSGGVADAIINNVTGILVPEKDVRATADALIKILSDKKLATRLGDNGRNRAKKLSWDNYVKKIIKLYEEVLT
jgi:phosphatidylinositol alpha-1,6-mannosyltransferase